MPEPPEPKALAVAGEALPPDRTLDRYKEIASASFADRLEMAQRGAQADLGAEIRVLRGLLVRFVQSIDPEEEAIGQSEVYQALIDKGWNKKQAGLTAARCEIDYKEAVALVGELRRTLRTAATLEGRVSIIAVEKWAKRLLEVVQQEVGDAAVCQRIGLRARAVPLEKD